MFTPKKIENALVKLFDLFDAEVMENLYENYDEEIEDISPKWLAKAFTENASTIPEFRMVCRAGDGIDYNGRVLFKHRGVILLAYPESIIENERMRTVTCTELWFLEDMTFAVVQYAGTMTKNFQYHQFQKVHALQSFRLYSQRKGYSEAGDYADRQHQGRRQSR